jgi:hypothetical protein
VASNGIFFRIEGEGEPLLLLHGLMVTGRCTTRCLNSCATGSELFPTGVAMGRAAISMALTMWLRSTARATLQWVLACRELLICQNR